MSGDTVSAAMFSSSFQPPKPAIWLVVATLKLIHVVFSPPHHPINLERTTQTGTEKISMAPAQDDTRKSRSVPSRGWSPPPGFNPGLNLGSPPLGGGGGKQQQPGTQVWNLGLNLGSNLGSTQG